MIATGTVLYVVGDAASSEDDAPKLHEIIVNKREDLEAARDILIDTQAQLEQKEAHRG